MALTTRSKRSKPQRWSRRAVKAGAWSPSAACESAFTGATVPGTALLRSANPSPQPQLLRQPDTLELTSRALGDLGQEKDFSRRLERRQALGEERPKLLFGGAQALAQDHRRADVLAEHRVRHGERHRLQDGGVVHQSFIDLAGRDLLAAAVDDLLQPPGQRQVAVGVDDALIAGTEPAVDERLAVRLRIVLVSHGDVLPANDDFAGFSWAHEQSSLVHDGDLRTRRDAHRSGFADSVERIRR